eukprot:1153615-Pelagomonas_calceolata.AAC.5
MERIHNAPALGVTFSVIDVMSVFTAFVVFPFFSYHLLGVPVTKRWIFLEGTAGEGDLRGWQATFAGLAGPESQFCGPSLINRTLIHTAVY